MPYAAWHILHIVCFVRYHPYCLLSCIQTVLISIRHLVQYHVALKQLHQSGIKSGILFGISERLVLIYLEFFCFHVYVLNEN